MGAKPSLLPNKARLRLCRALGNDKAKVVTLNRRTPQGQNTGIGPVTSICEVIVEGFLIYFGSMSWKRMLVYITGSADQELLLRNEYLATENRILRTRSRTGCG